jgi:hypothetical protein
MRLYIGSATVALGAIAVAFVFTARRQGESVPLPA